MLSHTIAHLAGSVLRGGLHAPNNVRPPPSCLKSKDSAWHPTQAALLLWQRLMRWQQRPRCGTGTVPCPATQSSGAWDHLCSSHQVHHVALPSLSVGTCCVALYELCVSAVCWLADAADAADAHAQALKAHMAQSDLQHVTCWHLPALSAGMCAAAPWEGSQHRGIAI